MAYRKQRNLVVNLLREEKRNYFSNVRDSKHFWLIIKSVKDGHKHSSIPCLWFNGGIATTDVDKAGLLNTFFSCCFNMSVSPLECVHDVPEVDSTALFDDLLNLCTPEEVYDLLCHIDGSKASGPDGISGKMLIGTAPSICNSLCQLFNLSIRTATIPAEWKISNIVPVHKSGDRGSVTNY